LRALDGPKPELEGQTVRTFHSGTPGMAWGSNQETARWKECHASSTLEP